jgi:hypothetical protein
MWIKKNKRVTDIKITLDIGYWIALKPIGESNFFLEFELEKLNILPLDLIKKFKEWANEYEKNFVNHSYNWEEFDEKGISLTKEIIPYLDEDINLWYEAQVPIHKQEKKYRYLIHPEFKKEFF